MRDLNTFQRELDNLFHRVGGIAQDKGTGLSMTVAPAINTYVKDGTFHLEAELPGVDTSKLDVRLDGQNLIIRGERKESHKLEDADYYLRESTYSNFERAVALPDGADCDSVHANFKDGLLEVTMPVTKSMVGGRKVAIEGLETAKKSKDVH
jgi:HSP20 family protein